VRWPLTDAAREWGAPGWDLAPLEVPRATAPTERMLRLGTFRPLWASKEVDASPALRFLRPRQVVELSPDDAQALGLRDGDRVEVGANGTQVQGAVKLRATIPGGSVFLAEGTHEQPANVLTETLVEVRPVSTSRPAAAESSAGTNRPAPPESSAGTSRPAGGLS
jgi:NADH-quinone oxidoreductase subunit G